ncbi:MAG: hypothetical protein ACYC5A_01885 [Thermoleophilia bacterium]
MLFSSINFWRLTTMLLFAAVLVLLFPWLGLGPDFTLEESSMEIVEAPLYGANFTFTVSNSGDSGEARVACFLYLYERGGDTKDDYTVIGIDAGATESGELFIPLPQGQKIHDWRVEVS